MIQNISIHRDGNGFYISGHNPYYTQFLSKNMEWVSCNSNQDVLDTSFNSFRHAIQVLKQSVPNAKYAKSQSINT